MAGSVSGNITGVEMYEALADRTDGQLNIKVSINDGPLVDASWLYPILGLVGETGEVAEKFKKILRDQGAQLPVDTTSIQLELGDVQWYLRKLAKQVGSSLGEIMWKNIKKLESRRARGVLGGSGDYR